MRKLSAILLLLIFLFNLVGYRFVFNYEQQKADVQLEASLDKAQYNDADLIAITIPLSMPYQTVQSGFERVNGEINISGKIYKYVKRKIVDGEMVLMCLPDQNKMRIEVGKNDFFKNTADIAQNNTSKKGDNSKSNVGKNVVSEYDQQTSSYTVASFCAATINNALSKKRKTSFFATHATRATTGCDIAETAYMLMCSAKFM